MEVILLEKVRNLGNLGELVKVKPGYARNFLVPNGKAIYANEANLAKFELRRAELQKMADEKHQQALERQAMLSAIPMINISAKAGEEGKLFGSITIRDVVAALNKAGAAVEKREVQLPQGSLRMIGEYEIVVELESDVSAIIKINVTPES